MKDFTNFDSKINFQVGARSRRIEHWMISSCKSTWTRPGSVDSNVVTLILYTNVVFTKVYQVEVKE